MARKDAAKCGTPSGYQAHIRRSEVACADCKAANAAVVAAYRKRPGGSRRHRETVRARGRAQTQLSQQFPDEFQRLYRLALAEIRGIPLGGA